MKIWIMTASTSALLGMILLAACSSTESTPGADAGAGGSGGARGAQSLQCGGKACTLPNGAGIEQLTLCCTEADQCGLLYPTASKCLVRDLPGNLTAACTSMAGIGDVTLQGCCGAEGCGVMDPFIGCMPNTALGRTGGTCTYDPSYDCTALLAVPCDGAEDCDAGKVCCGSLNGQGYTEVGCFPSCRGLNGDAGGGFTTWYELCHAGDACEDPAVACRASQYLPSPLSVCTSQGNGAATAASSDANAVNCGSSVCGAGQKCCLRPPHEPYCAATGADCDCKPADAAP